MPDAILTFATPAFVVLLLLEVCYDRWKGTGYYRVNDAIGSMATGVLSQSSRLVFFALGAWAISGLSGSVLPMWSMESWIAWLFAFVAYDFIYYWKHRLSHEINFLWAGHVVHHQSEEYNLSTALRQPSAHILTWILSIPLLLLGMPWQMIVTCAAWNLIYQFWVHTRHIKRLPSWYEAVMVTPSHHRVHHAQNPEYIDKNHGGVFIIWDKMFNTFQSELDDCPPIYGVRRPLHSFNPWHANLQLWGSLFKDAYLTKSWRDKVRIWFMPTGWRPADVNESHPIQKYPLETFSKFNPELPRSVLIYSLFHLVVAVMGAHFLTEAAADLSRAELWLGWVLVSLPLLAVGSMLNTGDLRWELARLLLTWLCLVWLGGLLPDMLWWLSLLALSLASVALLFIGRASMVSSGKKQYQ